MRPPVNDEVLDAAAVVPQHRERVYLVGYRKDLDVEPNLPDIVSSDMPLSDILHDHRDRPRRIIGG